MWNPKNQKELAMKRIAALTLSIVFALVATLAGCGGNSPTNPIITGTPAPTPAGTNSLTFISADPPSGATLKSTCNSCPYDPKETVTVTIGYNALQPAVIYVAQIGTALNTTNPSRYCLTS
jgi:hypothetical protein